MNKVKHEFSKSKVAAYLLICIGFLLCINSATANAKPKLIITKAGWSAKKNQLLIKGTIKQGSRSSPIAIFDLNGRRLAEATASPFTLTLDGQTLPSIPCSIRVESGNLESVKKVIGAPKSCLKAPTCQIVSPGSTGELAANKTITFQAKATLKDKRAGSLKTEWDFAGGVMQTDAQRMNLQNSNNLKTEVVFLRDNSQYRVRFSATDAKNRRCEDSIEVAVGTPPNGLPDKVAEQIAPKMGNELTGIENDLVVLPFEDLSMQSYTDSRLAPNQYVTIWPYSTLNAVVYRKARLPVLVDKTQVDVLYSAASNPSDPVGAHSINSTSRNWPTDAKMLDAQLQKTDMFEFFVPDNPQPDDIYRSFTGSETELYDVGFNYPQTPPVENDHGSFMPGIDAPYLENLAQSFRVYDPALALFKAWLLPVTDIDDTGKVNPFPLLRVEAKAAENPSDTATTDAVLTSGRDLHCRECHELGGIAADPKTQMKAKYYLRSWNMTPQTKEQPEFFAAKTDRIDDRELAAYWNIASIHDFYDGIGLLTHALGGDPHASHTGGGGPQAYFDSRCQSCHVQWQYTAGGFAGGQSVQKNIYGAAYDTGLYSKGAGFENGRSGIIGYDDSSAIHSMHGQFMYNADKTGILRQPNGRFLRWHPEDGPNPSPLFPVKDASGKILPMEENCLKCHGGKREQCYRDRMYTAGVTCYQCHGDMLAVGGFYKLSVPSPDGHNRRIPWFDQPDCGACHIGNGNQGKDAKNGFFSAGIMNTAFDATDPAATLRLPTDGPDGARFAVPKVTLTMDYSVNQAEQTAAGVMNGDNNAGRGFSSLQIPLFRQGKDTHGNVPCAACHGAAHAIWPNRDPSANDNVTALQLQGHTGTILECNVCHTADAFKNEDELDGGTYSGDNKSGILGGPHNTHPINDPYWWKSATGDTPNTDSSSGGGWHNNYAKLSGKDGEDQCASCHGNDHKGTRLSKTPVDRVFDFSGPEFNFAKLKKAGFKKKIIKVAAGSVIGCDTCHSIKTSCLNSPNPDCGSEKGHVDKVNHAPVFTSTPLTEVKQGEVFHDSVSASDPDGDPVTLTLSWTNWAGNQGTMNFDPTTGQIEADWASKSEPSGVSWIYTITADDGHGHLTDQTVTVNLACPSGQFMDKLQQMCVKIKFTSEQPLAGLDVGQTFTYQVTAVHADGLPLTFRLAEDAPSGMSITPNGLFTWSDSSITEDTNRYTDIIVSDGNGNENRQNVGFSICAGANHWNSFSFQCDSPINFTSFAPGGTSSYGMDIGQTYTYQVTSTHKQNLPVTYSLKDAPTGMTIDPASGHIEWTADASGAGSYSIVVTASDGQGGVAQQAAYLTVCGPNSNWVSYQCEGPISFASTPPGDGGYYGIDIGQTYTYRVTTEHKQNLPVTYSLQNAPASMTIDPNSGNLVWTAEAGSAGTYTISIIANDAQGSETKQDAYLAVCEPPSHWSPDDYGCQ